MGNMFVKDKTEKESRILKIKIQAAIITRVKKEAIPSFNFGKNIVTKKQHKTGINNTRAGI